MKQIAPNYTYNKTTGVITLTGVNIDRDQLLLIVNTTRNVTYYNFADSATTLQAFTQGANTSITLNSAVVSASSSHANADALTIYYDDQVTANLGNVVGFAPGDPPDQAVRIAWTSDDTLRGAGLDAGGEPLPIQIYLGNSVGNRVTTGNPLPISGTVTANTGLTQPLTDTQLRATAVSVSTIPAQGTTVTSTGFASIVSNQQSFTLVSASAGRRVLTVFNEGTGALYISAGATCSTTTYQVRLGAGDYWEAPAGQLSLAHTAVFGTIGSAKVIQVT